MHALVCRKLLVALGQVAVKMEGAGRITREDEQLLALAQGWAHGATHSLFFYYRSLLSGSSFIRQRSLCSV